MRQKRSPRQLWPASKAPAISNTLHKQERLCSRKLMETLFASGRSISSLPLKIVYMEAALPLPFAAQVMFVVPKRSFKKASQRNILKRRMREAYRLNKKLFYQELESSKRQLVLAILYTARAESEYRVIEGSLQKLMGKLTRREQP